jgi:hypothetical protein
MLASNQSAEAASEIQAAIRRRARIDGINGSSDPPTGCGPSE